jgi:hypothetical protein
VSSQVFHCKNEQLENVGGSDRAALITPELNSAIQTAAGIRPLVQKTHPNRAKKPSARSFILSRRNALPKISRINLRIHALKTGARCPPRDPRRVTHDRRTIECVAGLQAPTPARQDLKWEFSHG